MPVETTRSRAPGSRRAELNVAQKYSQFDATFTTMETYLTENTNENGVRLGVSTEQLTALTTAKTDWTTKFNAYKDPDTRTRAAVNAVKAAYDSSLKQVRAIQQQVKKDASVTKTDDDYSNLSIHRDKETRTPVTPPTAAPQITEIEIKPRSNKFRISESSGEGVSHKRTPYRTHIGYRCAFVPEGGVTPPPDSEFTDVFASWRSEVTVITPVGVAKGAHGFIKARYVTDKGDPGPESDAFQFTVN